jgi:hypothetical protein
MFKLKDIKGNRLIIFDLDDTLVKTDAKIKILNRRTKKIISELTPEQFNQFEQEPHHILNFEDFECPDILREGIFIHSIFTKLKYYYKKGVPVSIVTARSSSGLVREFFLDNGIDIHPDLVIAINDPSYGYIGNISERKQKAITELIDSGYTNLVFFDDNEDNLRLAKDVEGYRGSKIKLVKVD